MQSTGCVANLSTHKVNRITLYNDLLALYMNCNDLIQEYPLSMEFIGEQAVDLGGVSRDVMSAFWQTTYEKLFDSSKLFVPVVSPHVEFSLLPALGKILSHGYLCTGFLPTQIAFPSLAAMLVRPGAIMEDNILVESFLDYGSDLMSYMQLCRLLLVLPNVPFHLMFRNSCSQYLAIMVVSKFQHQQT